MNINVTSKIKKLKRWSKAALVGVAVYAVLSGTQSLRRELREMNVRNATVTIYTPSSQGSGVVVKSDEMGSIILTNKHICDGALQPQAELNKQKQSSADKPISTFVLVLAKSRNQGKPMAAQVLEMADNLDLCAIQLVEQKLPSINIASNPPKVGDTIYTHGSPMGMEDVTAHGKLASRKYPWFWMVYYLGALSVRPGSSGSGVYNADAELIGLVSFGNFQANVTGIVPLEHVKRFLARFGVK